MNEQIDRIVRLIDEALETHKPSPPDPSNESPFEQFCTIGRHRDAESDSNLLPG